MEQLDQLFDYDVLFSLTKFILSGIVTGPNIVRKLLSMLSHQCSYTLMVRWNVETMISLSDTSVILSDTFRQLQSRIPIEVELSLYHHGYYIDIFTVPRTDRYLCVDTSSNKDIVCGYARISTFFSFGQMLFCTI